MYMTMKLIMVFQDKTVFQKMLKERLSIILLKEGMKERLKKDLIGGIN